ncbi:hypothetical protein WJX79_007034, partial [Trebouxia sp. C0005]
MAVVSWLTFSLTDVAQRRKQMLLCLCTLETQQDWLLDMMKSYAVGIIAALCLLASAQAQSSTTYNITLTGAQNSPPISDPTVGQAYLAISFNTASNNITYQLFADNITEVMAAHIHISSTVGANGLAYAQIHTMPYPDGAIKGTFNSSSIISEPIPAVYGAALIDPFTG